MSEKTDVHSIDVSKITDNESIVIKYKTTSKPMKQCKDEIGITHGYANNLFQKAKKKLGMNSAELLIFASTTKAFNKEN